MYNFNVLPPNKTHGTHKTQITLSIGGEPAMIHPTG